MYDMCLEKYYSTIKV